MSVGPKAIDKKKINGRKLVEKGLMKCVEEKFFTTYDFISLATSTMSTLS